METLRINASIVIAAQSLAAAEAKAVVALEETTMKTMSTIFKILGIFFAVCGVFFMFSGLLGWGGRFILLVCGYVMLINGIAQYSLAQLWK